LIAFVVAAGCASSATRTKEPAPGAEDRLTTPKRLVAAIRGDPKFVSNALNSGGGGRIDGAPELGGLTSSGLSVQDKSARVIPVLAEELPRLESGRWRLLPGGAMETIWNIRERALWHDGVPFTADDVAFTARLNKDSEMPWLPDPAYRFMEAVEAPDARTVKVTWKEGYIRANEVPFNPPFPRHLLEQTYVADKGALTSLPYWGRDFVGTGPFKVKEFVRDSHVALVAFDRYLLGRPKIDELEVRFLSDDNALGANILAGTVDMTLGPSITVEQARQIADRWLQGKMRTGNSGWINMNPQFLNPDPPILLNPQFRRALYMAVDRKHMADELMYGLSEVAHSSVNPVEPEYRHIEPFIVRWDYDPGRATQLIEELGFRKGADGLFLDSVGRALSVQIMATQDDANAKPQFAVLDYWKTIGIAPEAEVVTQQRQRDLAYRANFRSFSLQAGVGYGPDGVNGLLSREARTAERNYVGGNYIRYMNPEVDVLVERYFATIPFDDRMQVLGQIVRHTTENVIWMPLYWRVLPSLIHERVAEVATVGEGQQWWNAYLWDVR
jgi:peptide/nickel transport system substrate-binding protein